MGLTATLTRAVHERVDDAGYLAKWSGRHAATAGAPAKNTPNSEAGARVPGRIFAGAVLAQPPDATVGAGNGVLLALRTAEDDAAAGLRAGEATSVVLLTATTLGMATCPMTEPLEITATRRAIQSRGIRRGCLPTDADPCRMGSGQCQPVASQPAAQRCRRRDDVGRVGLHLKAEPGAPPLSCSKACYE